MFHKSIVSQSSLLIHMRAKREQNPKELFHNLLRYSSNTGPKTLTPPLHISQ